MSDRKTKFRVGQVVAVIDEPRTSRRYKQITYLEWWEPKDEMNEFTGWWYYWSRGAGAAEKLLRPLTKRELGKHPQPGASHDKVE